MAKTAEKEPTIKKTWADAAYRGRFILRVKEDFDIEVEVVTRADAAAKDPEKDKKGFQVVHWRWVVERTFAWFQRYRRLSKDYEGLSKTTEAFIWLVAMRILASRLAEPVGEATGEA